MQRKLLITLWAAVLAAGVGCQREGIRVYTAPKDQPAVAAHSPHDGHDHGQEAAPKPRPQVTWTLPAGWQQVAGGRMSLATFSISGGGGKEAQVSITPLPMLAGREGDVVNMWREQVGLSALSPEEATKQLRDVQVGSETAKLFEIAGKPEGSGEPARIITAMVHRSDSSWFYKLSGDQSVVDAHRPAFIEFLKSISIKETAPVGSEADAASEFKWSVPSDWKKIPAGQMQVARFKVPEKNGAGAEVFVSVFPNDTGGTLANINRWRRQLKLADIDESGLASVVKPLNAMPGAVLADIANGDQRLLGAIVPRDRQYWFYKLLGGADAVGAARDNFIRFAQSTP